MKKWMILVLLILVFISFDMAEAVAQCPMCRMSAESNLKDGGTAGRGLNAGILYMLSMPYLLVAGIGYVWWKNKKNSDDDERHIWN